MRPQQEMNDGQSMAGGGRIYYDEEREQSYFLVSKMAATVHASVWLADGGVKKWLRFICYRMAFWGGGWLKELEGRRGKGIAL
jgi:hypothetical protein